MFHTLLKDVNTVIVSFCTVFADDKCSEWQTPLQVSEGSYFLHSWCPKRCVTTGNKHKPYFVCLFWCSKMINRLLKWKSRGWRLITKCCQRKQTTEKVYTWQLEPHCFSSSSATCTMYKIEFQALNISQKVSCEINWNIVSLLPAAIMTVWGLYWGAGCESTFMVPGGLIYLF